MDRRKLTKFERAAIISAATALPLCKIFCWRSGIVIKRWQASRTCVARAQSRPSANIGQVRIGLDSLLSRRATAGRRRTRAPVGFTRSYMRALACCEFKRQVLEEAFEWSISCIYPRTSDRESAFLSGQRQHPLPVFPRAVGDRQYPLPRPSTTTPRSSAPPKTARCSIE